MATIEELEQKVQRLERETLEKQQSIDILIAKSVKALDFAQHAYRIDHNSYVWVWDTEEQVYKKTNIHLCTPEVEDKSITERKLGDKAVSTRTIDDEAVTPEKLNPRVKSEVVDPDIHALDSKYGGITDGLQNQITANDVKYKGITEFLQQEIDTFAAGGVVLKQEFGSERNYGISQKTLTEAINKIWEKIEDITGDVIQGINMVVTPTYFISEDGCDIHISANTVETNGIFEKIQFFIDGELIHEDTNTEYVSFDHHLDNKDTYDYVVMCKAKIMGIEYTRQQIITRYNEFYIGAGSTYADVMDSAHARQLNGTMRHNYDVTFAEGNKLIIVMGASLRDGFIRADLNGAEIELTEETVTIDGKDYVVFTSEPWSAGDYNIDING